jgi:hypothetical protein
MGHHRITGLPTSRRLGISRQKLSNDGCKATRQAATTPSLASTRRFLRIRCHGDKTQALSSADVVQCRIPQRSRCPFSLDHPQGDPPSRKHPPPPTRPWRVDETTYSSHRLGSLSQVLSSPRRSRRERLVALGKSGGLPSTLTATSQSHRRRM